MTGGFPQFRIGNEYTNLPMISQKPSDTNDIEDDEHF
jgi:hypothetical protein